MHCPSLPVLQLAQDVLCTLPGQIIMYCMHSHKQRSMVGRAEVHERQSMTTWLLTVSPVCCSSVPASTTFTSKASETSFLWNATLQPPQHSRPKRLGHGLECYSAGWWFMTQTGIPPPTCRPGSVPGASASARRSLCIASSPAAQSRRKSINARSTSSSSPTRYVWQNIPMSKSSCGVHTTAEAVTRLEQAHNPPTQAAALQATAWCWYRSKLLLN